MVDKAKKCTGEVPGRDACGGSYITCKLMARDTGRRCCPNCTHEWSDDD